MGVKRTIQVQKPWGCSKSAITPQQLPCLPWDAKKEDIFTCWESRMMNSLKDKLHRVGEGLKMRRTGPWSSSCCIQMVFQKLGRGGCCSSWTGKALRQVWRHSLPWQPMGCSPSRLMTEVATGRSSQALESARFLPDLPLTQRISSCSFIQV